MNDGDDIWADDVLDRKSAATFLQEYLDERFDNKPDEPGFVLAINAEWGYGKSFMIKRWQLDNQKKNHPSIYFDAWQNDFTADPLLAFIAELEEGLSACFKKIQLKRRARAKVLHLLTNLWKPALTILASAGVKHLIGLSVPALKEAFDTEADGKAGQAKDGNDQPSEATALIDIGANLKTALEAHRTIKIALSVFKQKLGMLIDYLGAQSEIELPVYLFVDELDRCRPSYAIELLEGIKHLFGVPGVYFVIATNLGQLSESVKAVYGAGFDGQRYLRRFFDLQYTLGEPSNERFSELLIGSMMIPSKGKFIHGLDNQLSDDEEAFNYADKAATLRYILSKFADAFELTLRDQKQIAVLIEASLHSLSGQHVHIFFLVFLAILYHQDSSEFRYVANEHTFGERSQTIQSLKSTKKGFIDIKSKDDQGTPGKRSVSLSEVATAYLSNIRGEGLDDPGRYKHEFPYTLFNHLPIDENGQSATYKNYFDIVQQAGGFAERPPTQVSP